MSAHPETATTFPRVATAPLPGDRLDRWSRAIADVQQGIRRWQLWWLLGLNDIRQRYRRSRLGQLWITLSMAAFIVAVGFVYSALFRMELREYLPFLTVNIVVWNFIAGLLNDSCLVFTLSESYLRQERLPKTLFLMRLLVRNVLVLGHNAILIPIVFIVFGVTPSWESLLAIPGLMILFVNGLLVSLFLAIMCTRFRDLPQMVANIIQIAFFISPIMWQKKLILEGYNFLVDFNPFAAHLMIVTEPLLGQLPETSQYVFCLVTTLVLASVVLPFFARFRERIVYWL